MSDTENIISEEIRNPKYLKNIPEISKRFHVISKIGEGSFAAVFGVKCRDHLKETFALKLSIPTVQTKRIENELRVLKKIGGSYNVIKVIMSFRLKDHIFMLMPMIQHQPFGEYFWQMNEKEIQQYMKNLLIALKHTHCHGIIHRDIKPNNFLYDRRRKKFALVDFGLAHSEEHGDLGSWFDDDQGKSSDVDSKNGKQHQSKRHEPIASKRKSDPPDKRAHLTIGGYRGNPSESSVSSRSTNPALSRTNSRQSQNCCCGSRLTSCLVCRARMKPDARRSGTTGYRAPEVMMRVDKQTVAIDIWATGIILASFLTGRHPLFRAEDDLDVLHSAAFLIGFDSLLEGAHSCGKTIFMDPKPDLHVEFPNLMAMKEQSLRTRRVDWLISRCNFIRSHSSKVLALEVKDPTNSSTMPCNSAYKFPRNVYHLLHRLLEPNPTKRITAQDALRHSYFKSTKPSDNSNHQRS